MPEAWTGELLGQMHNAKVTRQMLADELGCSKAYVTMVLNGYKKPADGRDRCEGAFKAIMERRLSGSE